MERRWRCKELNRYAMELHRHDMIRPATAQFGIADNSMAMALPRDEAQRQCNELRRFAKAWKSKEQQRLCMQGVELTSEGNESF